MVVVAVVMTGSALGAQTATTPAQRPTTASPPATAKPPQPPPALPASKPVAVPQPQPFPADARIGLIDMGKVLNGSRLGQAGQQVLKAASDKWTQTLQSLAGRVQNLQQAYQAGLGTLSASAVATRKGDLDKAQLELQYQQGERDADLQQISQRLSDDFGSQVDPIVSALQTERKIWLIFDLSDMESLTVVAAHPGLDLSAEVIRRLDAK